MVLSCLYVNRSDRIHNETKPIQWSSVFEMKRQNQNRKFTGLKLKKSSKKNNNKNQTTLLHTYTLAHTFIGLDGKLWYLFHSIGQRRMLLIKFAIVSIDKNVLFNRFMYKCSESSWAIRCYRYDQPTFFHCLGRQFEMHRDHWISHDKVFVLPTWSSVII